MRLIVILVNISMVCTLLISTSTFAWAQNNLKDCSITSYNGTIPLNDLGQGTYQGKQGGLYPNGSNTMPDLHYAQGLVEAAKMQPLDSQGKADPNGKCVIATFGMSNANMYADGFIKALGSDNEVNPKVVIANCAIGGLDLTSTVNDIPAFLAEVDLRLVAAGCTGAQIQVATIEQGFKGPSGSFITHATQYKNDLRTMVQALRSAFPNLKMIFLTSREYAGYADGGGLNPEPYAYESGFAVKWLIEDQINGDPQLDINKGKAPWMAWGPYLWADGMSVRSDSFISECADFDVDGTHPSAKGQAKIGAEWLSFFKNSAFTKNWFLRTPPASCDKQAKITFYGPPNNSLFCAFGDLPRNTGLEKPFSLKVYNATQAGYLFIGTQSAQVPIKGGGIFLVGGSLSVIPIPFSKGPMLVTFNQLQNNISMCGQKLYIQAAFQNKGNGNLTLTEGAELIIGD